MTRFIRTFVPLIVAFTTIATGCYVGVRPYRGVVVEAGLPVVDVEPPPPQVEVYGVAPYPDAFWVGGYWFWEGGAYRWRGGHWDRPRAGYRWVPHGWIREGNGWRLHGGHWVR